MPGDGHVSNALRKGLRTMVAPIVRKVTEPNLSRAPLVDVENSVQSACCQRHLKVGSFEQGGASWLLSQRPKGFAGSLFPAFATGEAGR